MTWDIFICHASEDKDSLVRPLAEALRRRGARVWYDEFALKMGDSLRRSIDRGLAESTFGVVVLSRAFFAKEWPQYELDGLVQRERHGAGLILPIWAGVSKEEVLAYSPSLADKIAMKAADDVAIPEIVNAILEAVATDRSAGDAGYRERNEKGADAARSSDTTRKRKLDLLRDHPKL
jgi:hypothetical protein